MFPFALPARFLFESVRSSVHPFPAALPVIPPPASTFSLPAVQRPLCRRGATNHALQRTAHGGHVLSAFCVLRRHEPSLSLSPLGPDPLVLCWQAARGFPLTVARRSSFSSLRVGGLPFRFVARFVHPFPAAAPIIPPPESTSFLRSSAL